MKKKEALTAGQLSLILNISEATVKRLAAERQLPCEIVNRRPVFRLDLLIRHFGRLEGAAV